MANNRLYIRCKQCGETVFIGKHFGGALHVGDSIDERLNDFFDKHLYCQRGRIYSLELCEEFAGEMTDTNIDSDGTVRWY